MTDERDFYCPRDRQSWRDWLQEHHSSKDRVWLIYHRRGSDNYNLSWSEAVDEALCYGWIDSTRRTLDEERFTQLFTPRKAKSTWSKINKDKVKVLIANGNMTAAGLRSIATAKENGSWSILDTVEALLIPDDLQCALDHCPTAHTNFLALSKSQQKLHLSSLVFAKRPATRAKRIREIVGKMDE